jgi:hypothetical protein
MSYIPAQVGYFHKSSIIGKLHPNFQNLSQMPPPSLPAPAIRLVRKDNPEIELRKNVLPQAMAVLA